MGKVSCILTSYNQPKWLEQAILSVGHQTYPDWELIVLDDNSSNPEVATVLNRYEDYDCRISIYRGDVKPEERMDQCRYSVLINKGLDMAIGDYITYLTDDDYYLPRRFQLMVNTLDNHSHITVVFGQQLLQHEDNDPSGVRPIPDTILDNGYDIIDHCSVMHTRQVFEQAGYWTTDPQYWRGADGQYWNAIAAQGYKFYAIDNIEPTEVHRFHGDSVRSKLLDRGLKDLN